MRRARVVLAGAVAAGLTLTGCGFQGLYSAPLPGGANLGSHPFTITAYFQDVLDLVPQSAVKVNDVPVGKVTTIALDNCPVPNSTTTHWCARVKLEVNGSVDLPANAQAEVSQTSLLGEKYVALIPPPAGTGVAAKLGNGSKIMFADTTSAPEVEQVLGALSLLLNQGGLTQIQSIAYQLNQALGDPQRQQALRDLISAGGPLQTMLKNLDQNKNAITTALDNINELAATLNEQKSVITQALDTFPQALKILDDQRSQLVGLLQSLSNFGAVATRVVTATESDLVDSLKLLDPVVVKLAKTGSALPKSLKIIATFPFPLGNTRQIVKGDFANLDAVLNLNLSDQLCGLLDIGCAAGPGASAKQKKLTGGTAPASAATSSSPSSLGQMLIGDGG
ncbi:MAG: MCE family protein [Actinobacteria bacterium]|nr:MCE family protein [Actinomycetota bacterium]